MRRFLVSMISMMVGFVYADQAPLVDQHGQPMLTLYGKLGDSPAFYIKNNHGSALTLYSLGVVANLSNVLALGLMFQPMSIPNGTKIAVGQNYLYNLINIYDNVHVGSGSPGSNFPTSSSSSSIYFVVTTHTCPSAASTTKLAIQGTNGTLSTMKCNDATETCTTTSYPTGSPYLIS